MTGKSSQVDKPEAPPAPPALIPGQDDEALNKFSEKEKAEAAQFEEEERVSIVKKIEEEKQERDKEDKVSAQGNEWVKLIETANKTLLSYGTRPEAKAGRFGGKNDKKGKDWDRAVTNTHNRLSVNYSRYTFIDKSMQDEVGKLLAKMASEGVPSEGSGNESDEDGGEEQKGDGESFSFADLQEAPKGQEWVDLWSGYDEIFGSGKCWEETYKLCQTATTRGALYSVGASCLIFMEKPTELLIMGRSKKMANDRVKKKKVVDKRVAMYLPKITKEAFNDMDAEHKRARKKWPVEFRYINRSMIARIGLIFVQFVEAGTKGKDQWVEGHGGLPSVTTGLIKGSAETKEIKMELLTRYQTAFPLIVSLGFGSLNWKMAG
jgi:hypothetical protein